VSARKTNSAKFWPAIIIFDVDGVLVGTRNSYLRTVLQIVRHFTGQRVTQAQLHEWKNRPGFNDDWKLSHAWVKSLGGKQSYEEVKTKFLELYWGKKRDGNVALEEWLLPKPSLRRLAKRAQLAIFTGRVYEELDHTLDRFGVRPFFRQIVTVEDVREPKPSPEGLLKILDGRDPSTALYLGDNVDDAAAARAAGVPFIGILPSRSIERRQRAPRLKELGALAVLGDVNELEPWLRQHRA
jgi:HAD superfamily hydrolase (TIGR01548 family)